MSGPVDLLVHVTRDPDATLVVPAGKTGWITSNQRHASWHVRHRLFRHWRELGAWAAVSARLRPITGRVYAVGEVRLAGPRRIRDSGNWWPTAKAVVDGVVDAGILPGDHAEILTGPDMRLGPRSQVGYGALHLHLWALGDG